MSVAAHHAEWLSLVPASGPFLSLPVLLQVFPQALDVADVDFCAQMRLAHDEWAAQKEAPAFRRAWFEFIRRGLKYPTDYWREGQDIPAALKLEMPQYGETLRPEAVLMAPDEDGAPSQPRLLWNAYLPAQGLEKTYPTRGWNASPATRMAELLRATGVGLGLISNGEDWMLVHAAPNQATSYVSWNATLWNEERLTWRAFISLLGAKRFFALGDDEQLELLFEKSLENQQEVTDQLGLQVRRALELLVSTFEREDQNTRGHLLRERTPREIYEAALCVMMRLVFLFCAEERGMLPLDNPFYARNYAVSTLRAELRERADDWSEETLERGFDAWCRLLSTFRVVYGGIEHGECPLIAYGGGLFDPNKFAWLEGRDAGTDWERTLAEPLPVDNRTVLHLLEALQILRTNVPGIGLTARVVSFRALDIEQIGHVYEGLLDHTARRATTAMLSLKGKSGQEPEIALETLEEWRAQNKLAANVAKQTGRTKNAIEKDLAAGALELIGKLHRVCGDESLVERVLPFAGLVRTDAFDLPVVIRPGALFVTREGDRRATGTHYTPRSLTEPLVATTLDPLLYRGYADGAPASRETLLSPREILELKVCDPACGSGGVLVQACRYLSEKLLESWEIAEEKAIARAERAALVAAESEISADGMNENTRMNSVLSANEFADFPPARKNIAATDSFTETFSTQVESQPKADSTEFIRVNHPDDAEWIRVIHSDTTEINPAPDTSHGAPKLFLPYAEPVALVQNARTLPHNSDERALEARRLVADRCIYGVDSDPLAIEMAQLSLWLSTMAFERPFSFLEHALRVGDSLVGVDLAQLRTQSLDRLENNASGQRVGFSAAVNKARTARELIHSLGEDENAKRAQQLEAEKLVAELNLMADSIVAPSLLAAKPAARAEKRLSYWNRWRAINPLQPEYEAALRADVAADLEGVKPFHWPLEFPDAFFRDSFASEREQAGAPCNGGFDAIIGNPPFMGGQRITGNLGQPYRDYLIESLARDRKGSADLVAYFYLRAFDLIRRGGTLGLIATNTIAQGDTREVGLDQICRMPDGGSQMSDGESQMPELRLRLTEPPAGATEPPASATEPPASAPEAVANATKVPVSATEAAANATESPADATKVPAPAKPDPASDIRNPASGIIFAAHPSQKWPGTANLEVALVHIRKGAWRAPFVLAGESVRGITPYLAEPGAVVGNPHRLAANAGQSFIGSYVLGMGFVMEPDAAAALIARNARNAEVLQPYLNGEDLNSRPDSSPSRWVINFKDWPLDRESAPPTYAGPVAADYPDCLEIVETLVKPERAKNNRQAYREKWWIFGERRPGLYEVIESLPRVMTISLVTAYVSYEMMENNIVFAHRLAVAASDKFSRFAVLNSSIHDFWARKYSSSLGATVNYSPSDCFETFAFPHLSGAQRGELEGLGAEYHGLRRSICAARGLGLTKVYNLFHDAATSSASGVAASVEWADVAQLRALHARLDCAVARAYGWDDLALGHDFHATAQGLRFTLCEAARREVLDRLLSLNQKRFAAEVAAGLHDGKGKGKKTGARKGKSKVVEAKQIGLDL